MAERPQVTERLRRGVLEHKLSEEEAQKYGIKIGSYLSDGNETVQITNVFRGVDGIILVLVPNPEEEVKKLFGIGRVLFRTYYADFKEIETP